MECINIICEICNSTEYFEDSFITMEYGTELIKNIIDSNYSIHLRICYHHDKLFDTIMLKYNTKMYDLYKFNLINSSHWSVYNYDYVLTHKKFLVRPNIFENKLEFNQIINYDGQLYTTNKICEEMFLNKIKKGSIIIITKDYSIPPLEQLIFEKDFILMKKEFKCKSTDYNDNNIIVECQTHYVIECQTYTKGAMKNQE